MTWDISESTVRVNGQAIDMEPREGETITSFVKRVAIEKGLRSVNVKVNGVTVDDGTAAAVRSAMGKNIDIDRHTVVGM